MFHSKQVWSRTTLLIVYTDSPSGVIIFPVRVSAYCLAGGGRGGEYGHYQQNTLDLGLDIVDCVCRLALKGDCEYLHATSWADDEVESHLLDIII